MSNLLDLMPALSLGGQIHQALVLDASEAAGVRVQLADSKMLVECQVLQTSATGLSLIKNDAVLVWVQDAESNHGVVLGRVGPYTEISQPVVSPDQFAARPQTQVIEAQGDLLLRNGEAKLKLSANGDVEILCSSFTTRSRRLARLLAPIIKFN